MSTDAYMFVEQRPSVLLITRHKYINMAQVERPCAHSSRTPYFRWFCGPSCNSLRNSKMARSAAICNNYALRFIIATIAATKGDAGNLRLNQRVTTTKAAAQKAKENHFNYD